MNGLGLFVIGFMVGVVVGVVAMGLCVANGRFNNSNVYYEMGFDDGMKAALNDKN